MNRIQKKTSASLRRAQSSRELCDSYPVNPDFSELSRAVHPVKKPFLVAALPRWVEGHIRSSVENQM
jgi:hypothetical protein